MIKRSLVGLLAISYSFSSYADCLYMYDDAIEDLSVKGQVEKKAGQAFILPGVPFSSTADFQDDLTPEGWDDLISSSAGGVAITTAGVPFAIGGALIGLSVGFSKAKKRADFRDVREVIAEAALGQGNALNQFGIDVGLAKQVSSLNINDLAIWITKESQFVTTPKVKNPFCYTKGLLSYQEFVDYAAKNFNP